MQLSLTFFLFLNIHTFQTHPKGQHVNMLTSAHISATQFTGVALLNLGTFKDSHVCSSKYAVLTIISIDLVSFEMCYFTHTSHLLLTIQMNQDLKAK